jgi:deoxyribose-phosphate aldolase
MIDLQAITPNTFKVVIQTDDLTEEERDKLLRERDKTPAEFVKRLESILPENMTLQTYDHLNMLATVSINEP